MTPRNSFPHEVYAHLFCSHKTRTVRDSHSKIPFDPKPCLRGRIRNDTAQKAVVADIPSDDIEYMVASGEQSALPFFSDRHPLTD